ncbi:MAG: HIT domain-containing protein [Candidatus Pacearchaeota archaeon]
MFSPEQAQQIKQQLFSQIDNSQLPNKEEIKQQIRDMNEQELEDFLKEQQEASKSSSSDSPKCIFCSITNNDIPSHKIAENKKSIAILEINPLSKGHSIILPLEHITTEKLPSSALGLAKKVSKKIKSKLNPDEIKIETSSFQGHAMINVIPIYKDTLLEKKKASESELQELQTILEIKKRGERAKKLKITEKSETKTKLQQLSFRIP